MGPRNGELYIEKSFLSWMNFIVSQKEYMYSKYYKTI